ncbi:MAG: hypothetical protein N3G22_01415 [Candidatus Micrarchaeota archaeon]|nr:hypothetical protein [Candidatus Micrarchaeota archaeon]
MEVAVGKLGQAAVEFFAYASFFLFVVLVATAVFLQIQQQELSKAETAFAQETAYEFADQIHTTFIAGSGFRQSVSLPQSILGRPYQIKISRSGSPNVRETGMVYVEWKGAGGQLSFSAPTVTTAYDATTHAGFINVSGDFIIINPASYPGVKLNISNENGRIRFSRG